MARSSRRRASAPARTRRRGGPALRQDRGFWFFVAMSLLTAVPASTGRLTQLVPLTSVRVAAWLLGNYLLFRLAPRLLARAWRAVHPARQARAGTSGTAEARGSRTGRRPTAASPAAPSPPAVLPAAVHHTPAPATQPPQRPRGMFEPEAPWVGAAHGLTEGCLRLVHPDLRESVREAVAAAVLQGMSRAVLEGGVLTAMPTPPGGVRRVPPPPADGRLTDVATILATAADGAQRWMRQRYLDPYEVFALPHPTTAG
ncbi:MAG: hypothetical protein U0Q15_17000 [Kineosporiaceae bacterium]